MYSLMIALTLAQVAPLPPDYKGKPPLPLDYSPPKLMPKAQLSTEYWYLRSVGKPFVVTVGVEPPTVEGVKAIRDDAFPAKSGSTVLVTKDSATSYGDVTPTQLRFAAGLEVGPVADPFDSSNIRAEQIGQPSARRDGSTDATGPWLPQSEQDHIRGMWPKGVRFPKTLRFYKLRTASQSVAAFNVPGAGNNRPFVLPHLGAENANREFPWIGSGGMDFAEPGTWRNVTGMALPEGAKIKVWTAKMLVSTQYEIGLHWEFPTGTQMFDVLIRKDGDKEHIFNVRRRTKDVDGWDDGASFFPDVELGETTTYTSDGSKRSRDVLGVTKVSFKTATVDASKHKQFKEYSNTLGLNDGGKFFPPKFMGTGMTCNKCHNGAVHEAQVYGGPLLRGKDTVFSWYPIDRNLLVYSESLPSGFFEAAHVPALDYRWPIEVVRK